MAMLKEIGCDVLKLTGGRPLLGSVDFPVVRKRVLVLPVLFLLAALVALVVINRAPQIPHLHSLEARRADSTLYRPVLAALPSGIRRQMTHEEGRDVLLASGWRPLPEQSPQCAPGYSAICQELPEIRECMSASNCTALFFSRDGSTRLEIRLFDASTDASLPESAVSDGAELHWLGWQRSEFESIRLGAES